MAASTIRTARDEEPDDRPANEMTFTAAHYERWGWLVVLVGDRLLLANNDQVSAVELPAALGAEIHSYLRIRMLASPVVALPGAPVRWLMLTQSADDAAPVSLVRLRAKGGVTHRCGTLLPLPPSRLAAGLVTWAVPPSLDGPKLPPFAAVVSAARAVTETAGLTSHIVGDR